MKYEITKGSEKDFEGAPEWAVLVYKSTVRCFVGSHGEWKNEDSTCIYNNFERHAGISFGEKLIAERRPITEPVWDGEGLPPVGLECELKSEEYADYDWVKVRVVFEHNGELIAIVNMPDEPIHDRMSKHSSGYDAAKFRPIRSPEDVARDAFGVAVAGYLDVRPNGVRMRELYDAIAAGKIPGVKLEAHNGN